MEQTGIKRSRWSKGTSRGRQGYTPTPVFYPDRGNAAVKGMKFKTRKSK